MKINITHGEKREGLIFRTTYYGVTVQVDFSEEELHVIKSQKLRKEILLERLPPANISNGRIDGFFLYVSALLKGKPETYYLKTVLDAKAYEAELIEALQTLKQVIDLGSETDGQTRTYEL